MVLTYFVGDFVCFSFIKKPVSVNFKRERKDIWPSWDGMAIMKTFRRGKFYANKNPLMENLYSRTYFNKKFLGAIKLN